MGKFFNTKLLNSHKFPANLESMRLEYIKEQHGQSDSGTEKETPGVVNPDGRKQGIPEPVVPSGRSGCGGTGQYDTSNPRKTRRYRRMGNTSNRGKGRAGQRVKNQGGGSSSGNPPTDAGEGKGQQSDTTGIP